MLFVPVLLYWLSTMYYSSCVRFTNICCSFVFVLGIVICSCLFESMLSNYVYVSIYYTRPPASVCLFIGLLSHGLVSLLLSLYVCFLCCVLLLIMCCVVYFVYTAFSFSSFFNLSTSARRTVRSWGANRPWPKRTRSEKSDFWRTTICFFLVWVSKLRKQITYVNTYFVVRRRRRLSLFLWPTHPRRDEKASG